MLKQRRQMADQVAACLFDAEAAIDAALSKTAGLTGLMPALRAQAGLSALVGQDAVEHSSQAIAALTVARRAIVEAHRSLGAAQKQIGLGAIAYGGEGEKPPEIQPGEAALRRVPRAA